MWGNRLGWLISVGIVAATVGLYSMLIFGNSITPPTPLTSKEGAMDPIVLPGNPRALVPAGSGGEAASLYLKAIDQYKSNSRLYDDYEKSGKLSDVKKVPAIDLIIEASGSSGGRVFADRPEMVVRYFPGQGEALKPIDQLARVTMRIGLMNNTPNNKKPDVARKYFEAAFNLGYSLYNERLTYREFMLGQEFMRTAASQLAKIDSTKAKAFTDFYDEGQVYVEGLRFPPIFNPANRNTVDVNSGDVFNLARNSKERMWRIEAIMMLGHFRYFATKSGDQRGANKVLAELAADSSLEPAVMAAVKVAQDLTLADHNRSAQMP